MKEGKFLVLKRVPAEISGLSCYRLVTRAGEPVLVANEFLDMLAARGLSERTLRTYGYCLLSLWRWFSAQDKQLQDLTETGLLEYLAFQRREGQAEPAPKSMNLRLTVARSIYRFATTEELPSGRRGTQRVSSRWGRRQTYLPSFRPKVSKLSVKVPRRAVVPLKAEEVKEFLEGLETWRDLSIVGLLLFCGLRSVEVATLRVEDLDLSQGELRVRGKGRKERMVPLCPQAMAPLETYLGIERPRTARAEQLFVCLKGSRRGEAMTLAGLRSLFRYHRKQSRVSKANPHRFRHTFGADMARAGISLPALMKLMGHSTIRHTMLYVELSAQDVRQEFHAVMEKLRHQQPRLGENG